MLSIITPVLNGAKFIEKNISTIQSLDIPHEHIIVDGGSDDGTLEVLKKYPHLILLHQKERSGMYGAIHQGFSHAKGDYFAYVNCDDEVIKEGFEKMYQTIVADKSCDLVYSNAQFYYEDSGKNVPMKAKRNAGFFLRQGIMPFVQPSSIYTKRIYKKIGGLRYEIFKICGDLDMFQRMVLEGVMPKYVPEFSTVFLKYSGSLAAVSQTRKKEEYKKLEAKPKYHKYILGAAFRLDW